MKASILIPTYGSRIQYLKDELDSLQALAFPAHEFEIIVIDNGPYEEVAKVVAKYDHNGKHAVRYLKESKPGLGEARHAGARAALGEILVYLDDDVLLPVDWLAWMLKPYEDPKVGSAGGKVVLQLEGKAPDWLEHFSPATLSALDFGDKTIELVYPHAPWGCNMSVRKTVLYEVGGFNPDFFGEKKYWKWTGDGESGLAAKIQKTDHKIIYEPKAWIYHRIPQSRLTEAYFYQRSYTTGIMASYTYIRGSQDISFITLHLFLRSIGCFLYAARKYGSSKIKPKWRIRAKAASMHSLMFGRHLWAAICDKKLRDYICQRSYL